LLDSLEDIPPLAVREPHAHFTRELQRRLKTGEIPGLKVIGRFQMGDREHTILSVLPETKPLSSQNVLSSGWHGAKAIVTSYQRAFLPANLNDGTDLPWGSMDGVSDLYAGIVLTEAHRVHEIKLQLFSPEGRQHIHDIRIVSADNEGADGPDWKFVRARLKGTGAFGAVITIPQLPDNTVVTIELDENDPEWRTRTVWGFACLRSKGDIPNYFGGSAVYLREFEVTDQH
jgi:hypothetical protein